MNDTGPDAVPPPASSSRDDRIGDRLVPVPEPNLNSIPSVFASARIDSIVSSTELMKQAEHCGAFSKPQLNQTGLLNAAFCRTSRNFRSSRNACRSSAAAKYRCRPAHPAMASTTRPISCRTLRSRPGDESCPRKYFETTMLVACWDQNAGTSTPRCSKTTSPRSLVITADRVSHSISSKGSTPARLNVRGNSSPARAGAIGSGAGAVRAGNSCVAPADIAPPRYDSPPSRPGTTRVPAVSEPLAGLVRRPPRIRASERRHPE